jgi:hypothetical protein
MNHRFQTPFRKYLAHSYRPFQDRPHHLFLAPSPLLPHVAHGIRYPGPRRKYIEATTHMRPFASTTAATRAVLLLTARRSLHFVWSCFPLLRFLCYHMTSPYSLNSCYHTNHPPCIYLPASYSFVFSSSSSLLSWRRRRGCLTSNIAVRDGYGTACQHQSIT